MKKLLSSAVAAGAITLGGCAALDAVVDFVVEVYRIFCPADVATNQKLQEGREQYNRARALQKKLQSSHTPNVPKSKIIIGFHELESSVPLNVDNLIVRYFEAFKNRQPDEHLFKSIIPEVDDFDVVEGDSIDVKLRKFSNQILCGLGESDVREIGTVSNLSYARVAREVYDIFELNTPGEKRFAVLDYGELDFPTSFTLDDRVFVTRDMIQLCFVAGRAYAKSSSRSEFESEVKKAYDLLSTSAEEEDFSLLNRDDKFDELAGNYAINCLGAIIAREHYHASSGSGLKLLSADENSPGLIDKLNGEADLYALNVLVRMKRAGDFDPIGVLLAMEVLRVIETQGGVSSQTSSFDERYSAVKSALGELGYKMQLWE